MQRVEQNSNGEVISQTWRDTSGNIVDPGTVTVTITRADGTALVTAAATTGGGAAARTFTLTTTHTTLLDNLTVVWTSSVYGARTPEFVEIAGGFLFSLAEARAVKPLDNTTLYPTAKLIAMRTEVEQAIEDVCSVAFVPRYERETVTGTGNTTLLGLRWKEIRTIRSASSTYAGVTSTLGVSDLAALTFDDGGLFGYSWRWGYPYTIGYEHGLSRTPERIRAAALLLAKQRLVSGPVDDRASTFTSADSGGTYSMVVPGRGGSHFGSPEIDEAIDRYSRTVKVA